MSPSFPDPAGGLKKVLPDGKPSGSTRSSAYGIRTRDLRLERAMS